MALIGVISDTHGVLRPEALEVLSGVDHIVHAGDIGSAAVLDELRRIAPVTAVRGNNDRGRWARSLPESVKVRFADRTVYVLHDLKELDVDPVAERVAVVISGHSHDPVIERRHGVLYLNPGSAGPRRFNLPVCLATLRISTRIQARLHRLTVGGGTG